MHTDEQQRAVIEGETEIKNELEQWFKVLQHR